ncbi:uncharacterized protein MONOS_1710 [Monocercomonoides exilis]|uniref:uncharacterized protein n=1 Tax=Monocercomonoides exilis TaxID=2049356 RepID=UPI00355A98E8|nr:hypothetical protein MONOS_1710 [Monocercomonoides exilis]|eukprot:MONOS_1710.1-p1 / transcript=MONOS_1710.1 / gene=MONOS_1710 / organism=Monocercomonoides_exilis_PA203 / gene_product=unspecified product / transcript_product=unspecified product / location=Mono_scaffold00031:161220-161885(-) / protein_length=222 / sequence_SO=supercontig / SO=protein_coding / is_pseudo=false
MMEKTQNEYLHLPINTLIQLGNLVRSRIVQTPKRGPHRTLTPHDQLLVYLEWISSSDTLKKIASSLKITETMACQAITEVRPILLDVLERRFSSPPRPPLPAPGPFSNVALLVDATTVKVATPVIDYEDKKKLFDGHHYCYCMKFEVAVSSWFPHKALFVSDAVEGGVHDIELYQNGVERYVKYLKKTPEELLRSSEQDEKGSWSIMGDRGYQGQFPDIDL